MASKIIAKEKPDDETKAFSKQLLGATVSLAVTAIGNWDGKKDFAKWYRKFDGVAVSFGLNQEE